MASVTLTRTWVNLVATGEAVSAWTGRDKAREYSREGEVRRYAGGRFRSITAAGTRGQQTFRLRDVSQTDVDTLVSWIGQTVIVRDNRGRRMFGTFFSVPVTDRMDTSYYEVTLTVFEVTYDEGGVDRAA